MHRIMHHLTLLTQPVEEYVLIYFTFAYLLKDCFKKKAVKSFCFPYSAILINILFKFTLYKFRNTDICIMGR